MESMASMVIPVLESRDTICTNCLTMNVFKGNYTIQWNLNLVTTFDLVTIFQNHFSIYYIKTIYLVTLSDLVTVFVESKSVTKSRVHCTYTNMVSSW